AEASRPSAEFARQMDERVASGFPRKPRLRLPTTPWPAIAACTAVIVAIIVAVSLAGGGSSNERGSVSGASVAAPKSAAGVASAQSAPAAPLTAPRRVERAAELTLAAPASKLEDVANQIVAVADRRHGFVL